MSRPSRQEGAPRQGGASQRAHGAVEAYFRAAPVTVPLYALLCALVVGGLVMLATGAEPIAAYRGLFLGAFGSGDRVLNTVARATPYIGAALAVAFAFRAGLFNIGAEGQLLVGALTAAWVGTWSGVAGLPGIAGIPLVLLSGLLGGLAWGAIPGVLKARTGAHEVITTIMLNNIALRLIDWLVSSQDPVILRDPVASVPRTRPVAGGMLLGDLFGVPGLPAGILVALLLCVLVWFVIERTTTGFEVRTVGLSPSAATYAGMSVGGVVVLCMAASGALAGVTGATIVAGGSGFFTPGVLRNIGFDAIAIALLARANPFAVIPAALLWGALLAGAPNMQVTSGVSPQLVLVVQGLVLLFVAADAIVRWLFRIRAARGADAQPSQIFASGWGT